MWWFCLSLCPENTHSWDYRPTNDKSSGTAGRWICSISSTLAIIAPTLLSKPTVTKVFALWLTFRRCAVTTRSVQQVRLWSWCHVIVTFVFFVRARQLFQFLCTVTFRIYRLVHHCLPNNMKEEAFSGFLIDHRGLFHVCFYCPVLSFSLTPTYPGLRSCSERLTEQMNNSALLSWVESDYSSCSVSASFFSIFQPLACY